MTRLQLGLATLVVVGLVFWKLVPARFDTSLYAALGRADSERGQTLTSNPELARLARLDRFSIFPAPVQNAGGPSETGALVLKGLSSSPGRQAALISIGSATPQWIALGQPTSGMELIEWGQTSAQVRTSSGETVLLKLFDPGEQTPPEAKSGGQHAPS